MSYPYEIHFLEYINVILNLKNPVFSCAVANSYNVYQYINGGKQENVKESKVIDVYNKTGERSDGRCIEHN
jgi:hypothetical protein